MKTYPNPTSPLKLCLRVLLGVFAAGLLAATANAQSLSATAISASPASAAPGDAVTYLVTVSNSGAQFGPGATANMTVLLTHKVTGATITVNQAAVAPTDGFIAAATVDPATNKTTPGTGTFTFAAATLPLSTTEAGDYRATVTINSVTSGTIGTASFGNTGTALTVTGSPNLMVTSLTFASSTTYVGGNIIPMSLTYVNTVVNKGATNVPYLPAVGGAPSFVRIQVVLSSNPTWGDADDFQLTINDITSGNIGTVDNAGNAAVLADGATHTFSWNQLLPGNFSGSYYVLARMDSLDTLTENDAAVATINGDNVWSGNTFNPSATFINLLPSNFATTSLGSHKDSDTRSGSGYSDNPAITSDGRYIAFASDSTDIVSGDTNGARDIFIYDSQTLGVRRISVSQQGTQGNSNSNNPAVAGPTSIGHYYVAFASDATNMVLGDTNGFSDIFVMNTVTGVINRISVSSSGGQANNPSFKPAISLNGRYIVFESTATNLVSPATTFGVSHIYLYNRDVSGSGAFDTAGNTSVTLVDVTPGGVAGNASSTQGAISADGSKVAFTSLATNLTATATSAGRTHVYVRTIASGSTVNASLNTGGTEANGNSQTASLDATGAYVAFASLATDIVASDTNGVSDIFVRNLGTSSTLRVSVSSAGVESTDPSAAGFKLGSINPTISSDGRYISYASLASNLTAGDSSGQSQANDANNALDIFVRDRDVSGSGTFDTGGNVATTMVSVNKFGYQTNGLLGTPSTAASNIYPTLSANGRFVAFPSDSENNSGLAFGATNQLNLDSNGFRDIFMYDRRTNVIPTSSTVDPTITITSPGTGSSILVNTAIPISASATATVGTVTKVEFYVSGALVGSSTTFPYSATWTPTAVGSYILSALVFDSFGNQAVSSNIAVTVVASPSVGITSPVAGTLIAVNAPTTVTASAAASNPGATIASVQFFANGASIGTDTTLPYSITFTPTAPGTYALTALATDSLGTTLTSPAVVINAGSAPTIGIASPTNGSSLPVNVPVTLVPTVGSTNGAIATVQFFANGASIGTSSAFPFSVQWTPTSTGTYSITAKATDTIGNTTTSSASTFVVTAGTAASVVLTSPTSGAFYNIGNPITIGASVASGTGIIKNVEFFVNGTSQSVVSTAPFTASFTPSATGTYLFTAVATDNLGNRTSSSVISVTVTGNVAPTVTLTNPSSTTVSNAGVPITLAATATDSDGTIASVQFFANSIAVGTAVTNAPYTSTFTPTAGGTYSLVARATDNSGNVTTSSAVTLVVNANTAPTVTITSPATGSSIITNTAVNIIATAVDSDGTISSVQFFANGLPVGTVTAPPYKVSWTPTADGTYRLTAMAIDNSGAVKTSAIVAVLVGSTGGNATYTGIYQNLVGTTEIGRFGMVNLGGSTGVFIAHTTSGTPKVYFYRGIPLAIDGSFEVTATPTLPSLTGQMLDSNASGNLGTGLFIGSLPSGSSLVQAGFYSGSLTGVGASEVAAIVGTDGSIMLYVNTGSTTDAGDAAMKADGSFTVNGVKGTKITGRINPSTGLLTATLTGTITGSATGGIASAQAFSDGALRNLSTRGQVGTGADVLITGFVIGGNSPKNVLIRAVGPSMAKQGITSPLAHPQLQLYRSNGSAINGAYNDHWSANDASKMAAVGAFTLDQGTSDAALSTQLSPGVYTSQVSGVNGGTGVALIEFYDLDDLDPFSTQKVMNVSTRGKVGTGENVLIAGFVVSGTTPKKVLIRAVGPTLSTLGIEAGSVLKDPKITLRDVTNGAAVRIVRENDNWEVGNESALVDASATRSGAFLLPAGSKDSAILMSLPPGAYTAEVSGADGGTGVALVEVYEVP